MVLCNNSIFSNYDGSVARRGYNDREQVGWCKPAGLGQCTLSFSRNCRVPSVGMARGALCELVVIIPSSLNRREGLFNKWRCAYEQCIRYSARAGLRGAVHLQEELRSSGKESVTFYVGFGATANSLTLGLIPTGYDSHATG